MGHSIFDDTMAVMTWQEIERYSNDGALVLWPISVLEEHGPHMPIAVDIYLGYILSRNIRERLSQKGILSIIAPPNYWGINNVTAAFPGSFTLRRETLKALLYDTLASLKRWGFDHVFIFDLHGDVNHRGTVLAGIAEARVGCGIRALGIIPCRYAKYAGLSGKEEHLLIQPPDANSIPFTAFTEHQDIHAGALETSFMQRYYPDQVDIEKAKGLKPTVFRPEDWKKWASGWSDARQVVTEGYNGDPASIKPDLAEAFINEEAKSIAQLIESYLNGTYKAPAIG
jgi:creatinine amidohydrolase